MDIRRWKVNSSDHLKKLSKINQGDIKQKHWKGHHLSAAMLHSTVVHVRLGTRTENDQSWAPITMRMKHMPAKVDRTFNSVTSKYKWYSAWSRILPEGVWFRLMYRLSWFSNMSILARIPKVTCVDGYLPAHYNTLLFLNRVSGTWLLNPGIIGRVGTPSHARNFFFRIKTCRLCASSTPMHWSLKTFKATGLTQTSREDTL